MPPEVKLSDFYYKEPPVLSPDCLEELSMAGQAEKSLVAMKAWSEKYKDEIKAHREACLDNISNYAFMVSILGTAKDDHAKKVLETYYMKPGFIRSGDVNGIEREYICNYSKALQMIEKKSFKEFEANPVYGGKYE